MIKADVKRALLTPSKKIVIRLIDVRLNNQSQLAGFSKGKDLQYFLRAISNCGYSHEVKFAPTKELLNDYKKGVKSWEEYVVIYNKLIEQRSTF